MKMALFIATAGLMAAAAAAPVNALPAAKGITGGGGAVTPVAQGCGRGWYYSPVLRRCVRG